MNNKRKGDNKTMVMKVLNDIKAVWVFVVLGFSAMTWASDVYHKQFLKVDVYHATEYENRKLGLNNEIADLEIDLNYAEKLKDRLRIKELIIRKKAQLTNLKVRK